MRRAVSLGGVFGGGISLRMSFSGFPTLSFYGVRRRVTWVTPTAESCGIQFGVMVSLTQYIVRALRWMASHNGKANHLALGCEGEAEAYFHLRRLGYKFIATNFRVPHDRGEIDLIAWDDDVLCFIEVKTRTDDSFAPPSAAVTSDKQRHIRSVAKAYLRRFARGYRPTCRFDVVSVVPSAGGPPQITARKGAFSWATGRKHHLYQDFFERRFRQSTRNLPTFR